MSDTVNHPPHYNASPSGVECADVIGHMPGWQSQAMKYLWRVGLKGDEAENILKCMWWCRWKLNQLGMNTDSPSPASPSGPPTVLDFLSSLLATSRRDHPLCSRNSSSRSCISMSTILVTAIICASPLQNLGRNSCHPVD